MSGTLNGRVISFGWRRESLWNEMFSWALCMAGRLLLSVNDGSCEGASGKCDSKYGCSVSCSIEHQLLRPCCSTSVSMTVCGWGKHVSGDGDAERSIGVCNPGYRHCRWWQKAALCSQLLDCISSTLASVIEVVMSVEPCVGHAASQADRPPWERRWWSEWCHLLVQQVITQVEFTGWAQAVMKTTPTSVWLTVAGMTTLS